MDVDGVNPRAPKTIHFHLYISMFLHDLSILPKNSCHVLIPIPREKNIIFSIICLVIYFKLDDTKRDILREILL